MPYQRPTSDISWSIHAATEQTQPNVLNFHSREWYQLIPHRELTLNLLWAFRSNPILSAWVYLLGYFNYNTTPVVPLDTRILTYNIPYKRLSWASNGEEEWTAEPALEYYRCLSIFFPSTNMVQPVDTATFFPSVIPYSNFKLEDFFRQTTTYISTLITVSPSATTPSLVARDATKNAL